LPRFKKNARHGLPESNGGSQRNTYRIKTLRPGTASVGLNTVGEMVSGETALITAAAGGVGSWCVQLAKPAGNHVMGTCGSQAIDAVEFLRGGKNAGKVIARY
jgi:NADPH-dependent curcumin reductase CurA